ncbi:aldo/keto reductase [Azospira inquinata]|uniref:Aldo/keto reductase n=1 Tax=Azospira inquinata TaxID=2785627 RepID=A0A975SNC8_9RHOO|nr:aldo/keto reductase [Azospira inquinata]QWT45113.1 aldo/keto reductase [Azospira inquinata]QWT49554.1 aldo/keto reductase [Azospira inquinata]
MDYRQLGTSDLRVSAVCLGTMTFGQQNSEAEGHAQLDYARSQGINFFDTAEMYPVPARGETTGATEKIVGTWLKRQPRDQIVLATKAAGPGRGMGWLRGGQGPKDFSKASLETALNGSLARLQTDYVDLYQLHWPARNQPMFGRWQFDPAGEGEAASHDTPLRETLAALADLVKAGKIRYVGVSNEHPWGLMQFLRLADEMGLPRVVSLQNAYNLMNRVFDITLAEVCYREKVGLLAYSPLAFGLLSGKYLADPQAPGRVNLFPGFAQRYSKTNVQEAVAAYQELAARHHLSLTQLALAFCYRRWSVTSTIIGATSLTQLEENLAAYATPVTPTLLEAMDQIHLRYPNPAP